MTVFGPIFHADELVGFAACRAHWLDVGAKDAGGPMNSTEIYQEGLRLPPIKLYDGGRPNEAVFDIIRKNVRVPENLLGDLRAQLSAIHIGERGFVELVERWGKEPLLQALVDLMAYTERLARAEIAQWPDGRYEFTDYIDDDGMDPGPIPIACTVTVNGAPQRVTADAHGILEFETSAREVAVTIKEGGT
jgi:N-methylhydantoinase B